jgi:hypothetical protein
MYVWPCERKEDYSDALEKQFHDAFPSGTKLTFWAPSDPSHARQGGKGGKGAARQGGKGGTGGKGGKGGKGLAGRQKTKVRSS